MGLFDSLKQGLERTRSAINEIFYMGGEVDEDFWESLEDTLVISDLGADLAISVVENLRERAAQEGFVRPDQVREALIERLTDDFTSKESDILDTSEGPVALVFVGINGAGKTTTVGKLAHVALNQGSSCLISAADTFRAAAIEQLEVWAKRAGVEIIERERGADPAAVAFESVEKAEAQNTDVLLIDTAGRLHTSDALMRELAKVVSVTRKRADGNRSVRAILVIDATTGQNGLNQAQEFNRALDIDGLIVTKLDGTAKGGIALAISNQLNLPIYRIGVGEKLEDLQTFNARDFVRAMVGEGM